MFGFSANLNFLWPQQGLCDALTLAKQSGFDAVECHWPYDVPAERVHSALLQSSVPMMVINTRPGELSSGEFGLAAMPGRQSQARDHIDEAIAYAAQIQCRNIHVMAGKTDAGELAQLTYLDNLSYASLMAAEHGITVLIEPINHVDVPHYHLATVESAVETITSLEHQNIKLMFDCYHVQIMQGNVVHRLRSSLKHIGHVQFASVPNRAEPDCGELNYVYILGELEKMGYEGYVGAEYMPSDKSDERFAWLSRLKSQIRYAG